MFYSRLLNVTVGMKQKPVPVFVPNCIPVIITRRLFSHMHARDELTSIGLAGIQWMVEFRLSSFQCTQAARAMTLAFSRKVWPSLGVTCSSKTSRNKHYYLIPTLDQPSYSNFFFTLCIFSLYTSFVYPFDKNFYRSHSLIDIDGRTRRRNTFYVLAVLTSS